MKARILSALRQTPGPAFRTIRFLFLLMIPVSLAVMLLDESGLLFWFAYFAAPLMGFIGLPGEAALVFLTSILLNIYSTIAVIQGLNFSPRDIIILATLCTIAHSFIIEGVILKKTGSSFFIISLLRFLSAIAAAWVLNLILPAAYIPQETAAVLPGAVGIAHEELPRILQVWLFSSLFLAVKIGLIILAIIFSQKLLEEFGIMKILGQAMAPVMRPLGLSGNTGYLWIVANVIGLAFGSAVLIEKIRSGSLSRQEAFLFNHHVAVSHSQLEDNFLFAAIGAPFFWVALPRFFMAIIVVWLTKGCLAFRARQPKAAGDSG